MDGDNTAGKEKICLGLAISVSNNTAHHDEGLMLRLYKLD